MKDKYNQIRLALYSQQLAQRLSEEHFATHEAVTAQQLISFTPVKQVNLYMIRELLTLWNHEMANLRSPYFDFEHPEVKDALVQFMNVLSRKISIKREHFEPLLVNAIEDTIRIPLEPVAVFEEKFLRLEDLTAAKLQDSLKYQDIDKELYRSFIGTLSGIDMERSTIMSQLDRFLAEHEEERVSLKEVLDKFYTLQPLEVEELLLSEPAVAVEEEVPAPVAERRAIPAPTPLVPVTPIAPEEPEAPAVAAPFFRPVLQAEPKLTERTEPNLNDRFQAEQKPSLNDRLKQTTASTSSLSDRNQEQKIESLREAISINQRFAFINELFDGDNMAYHAAIKHLDEQPSAEDAKRVLLNEIGCNYNWTKKEDHVQKLTRLLERKFA
ncbi:hypothetical protein TH61_03120 [Rufibacter sp. DG15C]|uniref:hypothetical protein n=1 Tax=Rufibacter sp. DG15C TaxID=1379909 RepID=UPI00078E979A|nr:hypothetical protein [Rufibacter sp. DG15C]AMM50373.1 hypothetical protein TH61_03120 [Rufibacter sp. DG15C]